MWLILLGLVLILGFSNYVPGTFLSGWDNLHSELSPLLDLKRTLFAVWQEYRGVGLLDGMGHAADLVRQLILLPFSLLLPHATIRYFEHFALLFLGSLGIYFFLKKRIVRHHIHFTQNLIALIGSVFYLLNFGTISNFYAPLEPFSIFWAIFPWLILSLLTYLDHPTKRNFGWLFLASLLATPSFYIPTIFIVYLMTLTVISISDLVLHKSGLAFKKISTLFILTFIINAFWLLPFGYFVLTASQNPRLGHINRLSTQETILQNEKRGTLLDFVFLRGYYYDLIEENTFIMQPWRDHLEQVPIIIIGAGFMLIALWGLFEKNTERKYIAPLFFFAAATLLSGTPPISNLLDLFSNISPFFSQVFRSPYTKFITPAIFGYSVFFTIGISRLFKVSSDQHRVLYGLQTTLICLILIIFAFPAFMGNLFYKKIKVEMPPSYSQMFEFFKGQNPNSRVVVLPQYTFWGWIDHSWGYRGSGFIWWGLPQSTMDRAFDVWNPHNENFYWELSYAVYSKNSVLFNAVLDKYDVSWLVVDENIRPYYGSQKVLQLDTLYEWLKKTDAFSEEAVFDAISIYKRQKSFDNYISIESISEKIAQGEVHKDYDAAFAHLGPYIASNEGDTATTFVPFADLFTNNQPLTQPTISENADTISFASLIPQEFASAHLQIPVSASAELTLVDEQNNVTDFSAKMFVSGSEIGQVSNQITEAKMQIPAAATDSLLEVQTPKIVHFDSNTNAGFFSNLVIGCTNARGWYKQEVHPEASEKYIDFTSQDTHNCKDIDLPNLNHTTGYLAKITVKHIDGLPLRFKVINKTTGRVDSEVDLSSSTDITTNYYVIPPMAFDGRGYHFSFDNNSTGTHISQNRLYEFELLQAPIGLLKNMLISKNDPLPHNSIIPNVSHEVPSFYSISPSNTSGMANLVLNLKQAADRGWIAVAQTTDFPGFSLIGGKTVVNGWSNGWELTPEMASEQLYVLYVPQFLQYLGYIALACYGLYVSRTAHS